MYDAVTRDTYAQLFKMAEAKLPQPVREATIKIASVEVPVAQALSARWSKS
jgi:hypothetical protein